METGPDLVDSKSGRGRLQENIEQVDEIRVPLLQVASLLFCAVENYACPNYD